VESSRDYAAFPRLPGFVISDYDEDNPAEFDFPVARPLPIDANHVETVRIKGHRYVIRYEWESAHPAPTLFQTQQYYEKLAADAGFTVGKSGAVGNVTETFHRATPTRAIWAYLEPAVTVNVLTSSNRSRAPAATARLAATTAPPPPSSPRSSPPPPPRRSHSTPPPPSVNPDDDSLYTAWAKMAVSCFRSSFSRARMNSMTRRNR